MHNLFKTSIILFIVIAFNLNTFGQHQFGIKAGGGISRIYGSWDLHNPPLSTVSTSFSPSFQAGLYYNLPMGQKSSLGTELLFSQMKGGQTVDWDYKHLSNTGIEGTQSDFTHQHISCLSLPVYYGITFNRLTFNAGVQVSYALSSSGSMESNYNYTLIAEDGLRTAKAGSQTEELDGLDIKAFDFGPRAGMILRLTNRLSMEGMFYYGLNNIRANNSSEEELKIQQMTVGIRYAF